MKKFFMAAALAVMSLTASAQVWVAGTVNYGMQKPDGGDATHTFTLAPEVGYNFSDKLGVGISLGETIAKTANVDAANAFSIAPFARYTFAESGSLKFFLDGGIGFNLLNDNAKLALNQTNSFFIGIAPGIKYELSEKWGLVAKVGALGFRKYFDNGPSEFGLGVNGNDLSFGLQYNF